MSRIIKIFVVGLAVAGLTAGVVSAGNGGNVTQKAKLYFHANLLCNLSEVLDPGTLLTSPDGRSIATIQYKQSTNTVSAKVTLRGAAPNTSYKVRLIQGVPDCFTVDATLVTNNGGNGKASLSEVATSTKAIVAVCDEFCAAFWVSLPIFEHPGVTTRTDGSTSTVAG